MLRVPPHVLVTTPESLYLLLTAEKGRALLRSVRTVIVDEIHAVARDKRGAHLALSLERLEALCTVRPVRIGLSATQRPIEEIARFLVGAGRPDCSIVDSGSKRLLDLAVEVPRDELQAVASKEQRAETHDRVAQLIREHRTTLVFVNTRRQVERVAHALGEHLKEAGDSKKAVAASAEALAKLAQDNPSATKDMHDAVDKLWKDATAAGLQATASSGGPTAPKPAQPWSADAWKELPKFLSGPFPLSAIRVEPAPGASVRFLVDQKELAEGPVSCAVSATPRGARLSRSPSPRSRPIRSARWGRSCSRTTLLHGRSSSGAKPGWSSTRAGR